MGTVVGQAIDYLVAQLPALAVAAQPDAMVIDGITRDELSTSMIWIGRAQPEDLRAALGTRSIPTLGRRRVDETWSVDGFTDCRREGTTQKAARDAALSLFDAVAHLVGTDPSMGGLLTDAWYVTVPSAELVQPESAITGECRAVVLFSLDIRNRYQP